MTIGHPAAQASSSKSISSFPSSSIRLPQISSQMGSVISIVVEWLAWQPVSSFSTIIEKSPSSRFVKVGSDWKVLPLSILYLRFAPVAVIVICPSSKAGQLEGFALATSVISGTPQSPSKQSIKPSPSSSKSLSQISTQTGSVMVIGLFA